MAKRLIHVRLEVNGDYWRARADLPNGEVYNKGLGNRSKVSKRKAEAACQRLAAELSTNHRKPKTIPGLEEWFGGHLRRHPEYSPATLALYEQAKELMVERFGADRPIDAITELEVSEFAASLETDEDGEPTGRSENTCRKILRTCSAVFGPKVGAVKLKIIDSNPFDAVAKSAVETNPNERYVTPEELDQLLEACPTDKWRCLFAVCRLAGVRRGEALRLTWADVNWDKSILIIKSKRNRRTTKDSTRLCPIVPELMTVLRDAFARAEEGSVKVCSMDTGRLVTRARKIITDAGIQPWDEPFQTLRCNRRTDWDTEFPAADIDRWMGHDERVARKHYHQTRSDTWARVIGQAQKQTEPTAEQILQALKDPKLKEQILTQLKETSPQNSPNSGGPADT